MKRFHSLALALLMGAALSSCSSGRYFQFAAHSTSYHRAPVAVVPAAAADASDVVPAAAPEPALTASAAPVAEPTVTPVTVRSVAAPTPKLSEQLAGVRAERPLTRAQERRYERVLTRVKALEAKHEATGQQVDALELILAIFLPPIGVLVHEHALNTKFWISLILTFLFFIPGMIYSILVVTDTI